MKHLFKALAEFQQSVPVIFKGATAGKGNYSYQYADLPSIFNVINQLLKEHGLGFTQLIKSKDGLNYLATCIFHVESGEVIESETLTSSKTISTGGPSSSATIASLVKSSIALSQSGY